LESRIGKDGFETATIIFLGDYCDRGPKTKEVLDFLISLPLLYPNQTHVFLCGNHDLAFAAFIGALSPPPDGSEFSATWTEYEMNQEREGWFKGEGYQDMHVQGRRWGGSIRERLNLTKGTEYMGSIYDAEPTFKSYGVPHGSADLSRAVPKEHHKFLSELVWFHEEEGVYIDGPEGTTRLCCKLMAVHAGLAKSKKVDEQIRVLKAKDTSLPKVEALSGRKNVWDIPKELRDKPILMVSGHHGKLHIDGFRLIIDQSGGIKDNPLAAIVLPTQMLVRDID